jgi:hypothetical protein
MQPTSIFSLVILERTKLICAAFGSSFPLGGKRWELTTHFFLHPPECLLLAASISQMNAVENVLAAPREFQVLCSCF